MALGYGVVVPVDALTPMVDHMPSYLVLGLEFVGRGGTCEDVIACKAVRYGGRNLCRQGMQWATMGESQVLNLIYGTFGRELRIRALPWL